jgi:hypothetical protein
MIVPLVLEDEWIDALGDLPLWDIPPEPILVLAPHPDNETLGAGGFIAAQRSAGIEVMVAAVTDGENAYPNVSGSARFVDLSRGRTGTPGSSEWQAHSIRVPRQRSEIQWNFVGE